MTIEGKRRSDRAWVICACLLGIAFSAARAEDKPPAPPQYTDAQMVQFLMKAVNSPGVESRPGTGAH